MKLVNGIKIMAAVEFIFGGQKVWAKTLSEGSTVAIDPVPFDSIGSIAGLFNYFAGLLMMFVAIAVPLFGLLWVAQKNERKIWSMCLFGAIGVFVILLLAKIGLAFLLAYRG